MWHKVLCLASTRVHSHLPQPAQPGTVPSLSLPRSNGASQSGDTIIASAIQFPLSIIYCICCTRRRRRWPNRFLSGGTESTLWAAGQSRAGRFARDPRAPRPPLSPPAGADATGGLAVGLSLSLGPGPVPSRSRAGQNRLGTAGTELPLGACRKSPV